MFEKILVPIDLGHTETLARALGVAAELAKSHDSEVIYMGVYGNVPTDVARFSNEYPDKLKAFAEQQAQEHGIKTVPHAAFSTDPAVEIASTILSVTEETGADVIVMASHVPGWTEHIFHSNAGYTACHAKVSVFVIR